MDKHRSVIDY